MTKRNTEWSPMWRDANEPTSRIEARTAEHARAAALYVAERAEAGGWAYDDGDAGLAGVLAALGVGA